MRRLFIMLSLIAMAVTASAVPVKRGLWTTITLADGTQKRVTLVGDEHMHFMITEDGTRYVKSPNADYYVAADTKSLNINAAKRRMKANRHRALRMNKAMKSRGDFATNQFLGEKKGLIILVNFANKKFLTGHDNALFTNIANAEGYSKNGFKGSVSDYFKAQSDGKFQLTFDVVGPVTLANNYKYYGGNDSSDNDQRPEEMVVEACKLVDDQVDFSKYDWDGDGEVDQVFILYAGHGEADYSDIDGDVIWPHEWELASSDNVSPITLDGVVINTYACSNEINRYNGLDGISTICHEFSHCLGYPDLYDTMYSGNFGMGDFDLMCSGTNVDDGYTPPAYSGYERWVAGWQTPIELTEYTEVTNLKPITEGGEFYVIYNDANHNEYYTLENRQQQGYDKYIPGKGLMITHVDYNPTVWDFNIVNSIVDYYQEYYDYYYQYYKQYYSTAEAKAKAAEEAEPFKDAKNDHQRLTIFHADNDDDSKYWNSQYGYYRETTSTDLYPYVTGSTATSNYALTDTSKPAATLYNANSDGRKYMGKPVTNITQNADGTLNFVFGKKEGDPDYEPVVTSGDYVKVTATNQIAVGNEYLLVNEEYQAVASAPYAGRSNAYLTSTDAVVANNSVDLTADMTVFTLGGTADSYSLKLSDGTYLNSSKAKNLTTSPLESKIWKINQTADGFVVAAIYDSYGVIQYNYPNGSSPRFMNYTSPQKPAVLYVKQTATAVNGISVQKAPVDSRIYSLDGRCLGTNLNQLPHGIYIIGGRKIAK